MLLAHKLKDLGENPKAVLEPFEFERIKAKRKKGEKDLFKKKEEREGLSKKEG